MTPGYWPEWLELQSFMPRDEEGLGERSGM